MSEYAHKKAIYEAELINAQNRYFEARPQLLRSIEQEKLFEAGFRMAFEKIERNIEDMPIGFQKAVYEHFWELTT